MFSADGGVFAFGDAPFLGSLAGRALNAPIIAGVAKATDTGYWLLGADGGVFAFNAPFRGSLAGRHLNRPVVDIIPFGNGYVVVAGDGGAFNFSSSPFLGALGGQVLPRPIIGAAALPV
jgi:hypothetical protein